MGLRKQGTIVILAIAVLASILSPRGDLVSPLLIAAALGAAFLALSWYVDRRPRHPGA
jgi:Sec-independent protein secretion pathway component TatC